MSDNPQLYLSKTELKAELERCLNCKTRPCMNACPVNCNPQEFISHAMRGNFREAIKTISRNNPMGQTCGLICPDKFCMRACTRRKIDSAVRIPCIQAALFRHYRTIQEQSQPAEYNGKNIAVIGSGPAGIAAASVLSSQGCKVCIFECDSQIGGALNLIPDSRLPHAVIEQDWKYVFHPQLMTLKLNTRIDNIRELFNRGFDGVIAAGGEPNCAELQIPGEKHCLSHLEYLRHPHKYKTTGRVAVIGGGNVAADCAFTARSSGAGHVEMFVRRRNEDMRISQSEYQELLSRGIVVTPLTSPSKVARGNSGLDFYVYKNLWKNNRLLPIPDSVHKLPGFDLIIKAVGSYADPKIDHERIIYAGDCKTGGSTIVEALASGRAAAETMLKLVSNEKAAANFD